MENNKLQSMTDFVLSLETTEPWAEDYANCVNFAKFLKQLLELWMFVPCDEDGNILEYPIDVYYIPDFDCQKFPQECYIPDLERYQQAQERILFEGFTLHGKDLIFNQIYRIDPLLKTIEDLVKYNPILTETAIKQIYENN